ncbi:hypothetical protein MLD38_018960 [Melastoma candidum]|uniref:Uncharacterized protein n=1 Tax=Melastoma candidum TaxID=119954 RepID=A0ACB9QVG8_9MYRT|nr:hypothetical protein MLD38_018960 [Melastoma candidum]
MAKASSYDEEFIVNSRGLELFTCQWLPASREPKALIFICHGYAMECSITMESTAIRLVEAGYAVFGLDYEGHGKSGGLSGYMDSFDDLVDDCCIHFRSVCERKENKGRMRYMLAESMGGAVSLLVHRKMPGFWDGAVLVAPMCKIADDVKPPTVVVTVLMTLCNVIPTWKIIPTKDIIDLALKQPHIRDEVRSNPYCYKGRPRLKTGHELLRVSLELEKTLNQVSLPFIVLHGEEDRVTDIGVSRQLYKEASSSDKTFKSYPGMWHGLLYGETPENINAVFVDIIGWLDAKTSQGNSRLEREQKMAEDDGDHRAKDK